jgi:hypothetical protein
MNFLIGFFFISAAILFASLPFLALFLTLNVLVFDVANFFRRVRKLPQRPKPWVFKDKKSADIALLIGFLAVLAFGDFIKPSLQLLVCELRHLLA